ncbi:MAG: hypothetical protein IE926_05700 [Micrococcales bacterium]|nr:hypothetical protein [Micrococcales bacterium]
MSWRPAPCLVKLRDQVNRYAPDRSKRSDGMIGDAAHAATVSDHNPDAAGIVRAFDVTHDPAHGLDCGALAAAIVASRDPRVKYLIWNGRVIGSKHWTWTPYDGADPHTSHLHVSVVPDGRANSTADWRMPTTAAQGAPDFDKELDTMYVKNPITGKPWEADDALWSIWTYGIRAAQRATEAARDAKVARALAEAQARNGVNLTPAQVDELVARVGADFDAELAQLESQLQDAQDGAV